MKSSFDPMCLMMRSMSWRLKERNRILVRVLLVSLMMSVCSCLMMCRILEGELHPSSPVEIAPAGAGEADFMDVEPESLDRVPEPESDAMINNILYRWRVSD